MNDLTNIFWSEGLSFAGRSTSLSGLTGMRIFKSFYGVSPEVCSQLWHMMDDKPENAEPKHLLWAFIFMKSYNTEHVNAGLVMCDEKTFRKWVWLFIDMLSSLQLVMITIGFSVRVLILITIKLTGQMGESS